MDGVCVGARCARPRFVRCLTYRRDSPCGCPLSGEHSSPLRGCVSPLGLCKFARLLGRAWKPAPTICAPPLGCADFAERHLRSFPTRFCIPAFYSENHITPNTLSNPLTVRSPRPPRRACPQAKRFPTAQRPCGGFPQAFAPQHTDSNGSVRTVFNRIDKNGLLSRLSRSHLFYH